MQKRFLLFAGILILGLLMTTGCSNDSNTSSKKQTFLFAVQADARILDPQMSTDNSSTNAVFRKAYETLVTVDQNNQLVPLLAAEWKQLNPLTWEFTLREGVKFHDGTIMDANAVKASFDRILDPNTKRNARTLLQSISEVKVVSPNKIQVITKVPFSPLLLNLAHGAASIISPKAIEEDQKGTKLLAQNPVGTGPFKFESWMKGDQIVYQRFDEYWGEKPEISKLILKVVPEDSTRMAMVKTGEAQGADQVPLADLERINKDSAMKLVRTPMYRTEFLAFNTEKAPFSDQRVRLAIAEAIDFPSLISGVYQNTGTANMSVAGPAVFGYNPNLTPYPHNIENAKKLLAEAGYPNGFKATLSLPDRKTRIKLAEVIQAQLKPIGIDLDLIIIEQATFFKEAEEGKFDICIDGWSNQTGDADYSFSSTLTPGGIQTGGNFSRYKNPTVASLIDQARAETNPDKRKELYFQAQEIIRDEAPVLVTHATEQIDVVGKNITGLWVTPGGITIFHQIRLP